MRATSQGWSDKHTEPTFSAIGWDRWRFRGLYSTGADGGLFWDCTDRVEPFTVVVEDCVGIGRAFGGGVASCLARPDEPITFRRCHLWALDWWGDTAGLYVRVENQTMPERPDVLVEDCTLVSPQCSLKAGNFGFTTYTHVKLNRCRLVTLNFSQPRGTPVDGIIQSVEHGKYLHVDLEDCTLMGYKVFGVRVNKDTEGDIAYTTKGSVRAYVQFEQAVPEGFHRLTHWPVEVFQTMLPPEPRNPRHVLTKEEVIRREMCELSPILWKNRLCYLECVRPGRGGGAEDHYLVLKDAGSGQQLAKFAVGYSLASALVHDDTLYVFASRFEADRGPWNDVTLFKSADLEHWDHKVVIEQEANEHLFNTSVCEGPDGFVMAYETSDTAYPQFTVKFARSSDLENWTKAPGAVFGTDRYTACPCIRYANGCYYMMYLERRTPRWFFETFIARSKDLETWELSPANPVLSPDAIDEGINTSDPEIIELDGKTHVYYAVGDQRTWMNIKRAVYPGSQQTFFESWFVHAGIEDTGTAAYRAAADAQAARHAWYNEAKFGMFIHWGLYAVPARNNKGPYVSWMMANEGIPAAEYEEYADQFKPAKFDPAKWMKIAREAGMRYVTFTSKHHEGFCMFDSALTDYDAVDRAAGRDFVRALIDAARAADMRICFYYSMLDWHHADFKANLPRYVDYMHAQVRELCSNYGHIDGIWFDGEWDYPAATWRAAELVESIRALQPNAAINDRLGKGERGVNPLCDFYTREQLHEIEKTTAFERKRPRPWEACMTIGTSWGYKKGDAPLKSAQELIRALVDVASRGGNMLLNVGPTADGEIPPELVSRLRDIGAWMAQNGEAVYGTYASPFESLPAGKCTTKDARLYIHLEKHPGAKLALPGLKNTIKRAWFLKTGAPIEFDDAAKNIALPDVLPDDPVTVVAIELDGAPVVE